MTLPEADLYFQTRGRGPAALFLHGFALDHTTWLPLVDALPPDRLYVLADLRGHGRSDAGTDPANLGAHHAGDVIGLIDALSLGEVDLVGHSMGGHIARAVAEARPELVRSLALFGVMDFSDYRQSRQRPADALMNAKERLARDFAAVMLAPDASLMTRARAQAMIHHVDWSALYPGAPSTMRRTGGSVTQPVLLATGAFDAITPPDGVRRFAAGHPTAAYVEIPRSGHLAPLENPGAISEVLEKFWRSLPRTAR